MKQEILKALKFATAHGDDFPHRGELRPLLASNRAVAIEESFEGNASCAELLDLYQFRLTQLSGPSDLRFSDVDYLCRRLRERIKERCLLCTIDAGGKTYSLFLTQDKQQVLGCIKLNPHAN